MSNLEKAKNILSGSDYTCVICSDTDVQTSTLRGVAPLIGCTACRYCCDGCPSGINIPDVFKTLNTVRLYGDEWRASLFYRALIEKSGKAKDCIGCGQCESVCTQHLPIIELLAEASERLDK